jgi:hypothetical protein
VKKYYFEKEDQVKQLQNSLAHQRLSQSRTSLDDSEYTTRFSRLDGLVAQLSFSIRKSWRSIPPWLSTSVNKDAVATGKQEMTAIGRAFISWWLVHEVFDKYFHPDLDVGLSIQLKSIQQSIRRYAPIPNTTEEEEYLTSKVVNWRLATLEGLQDMLRSPQCPTNRQRLIDTLKDDLVKAISVYLQDPAVRLTLMNDNMLRMRIGADDVCRFCGRSPVLEVSPTLDFTKASRFHDRTGTSSR